MEAQKNGLVRGLHDALAIEHGDKAAASITTIRDGVVLRIVEGGREVFALKDTFEKVAELKIAAFDSPAAFLKRYRDLVRQTQETMARLYGVDVSTYRNWEQGHRSPNATVRHLMALSVFEPAAFFRMAEKKRGLEIA